MRLGETARNSMRIGNSFLQFGEIISRSEEKDNGTQAVLGLLCYKRWKKEENGTEEWNCIAKLISEVYNKENIIQICENKCFEERRLDTWEDILEQTVFEERPMKG